MGAGNSEVEAQLLALTAPIAGEVCPVHQPLQGEIGGLASFEDGGNDARCKEGQGKVRLHVRAREPLARGKLRHILEFK